MNDFHIGDGMEFALVGSFFDSSHETELMLFVNGKNILAYSKNGQLLTTRWNLDELAGWLRDYLDTQKEDPYPVSCAADFAA